MTNIREAASTRMEGWLQVRAWKRGKLLWELEKKNLVVNGAAVSVAELIGGTGTIAAQAVSAIGFGSGTSTPVVTQTGLTAPAYYKALTSVAYPFAGQVQFTWQLSYSGDPSADAINIQELGLYSNSGAVTLPHYDSGSSPPSMTLFSRVLLPLGVMLSSANYTATWTVVV
jgi:hypothetical protein